MGEQRKPDARRGEMAFIVAIIIGLALGLMIKKVRLGLLLGLILGGTIVLLGWMRSTRK